ncbi:LysR family transcriptional regulator [Caballeronia sp. GAWG2-1]|uniref:LysR family transcriptional regulator n=1 Tax=Caballeronia sp. GAWG2-1 TaxID=2921744 RepID=UPI0020280DF0|nr:LysR family transcriptional regulator [Caballeronia sp. GAWG2-1]
MRNSFVGVDLRALQAFVAVCETRSMTEAARVLGVTQSAVSQLIAALEREQGVALFDREFRPVRPNAAGRILFDRAGALLEHAQAVSHDVRTATSEGVPSLRIGCVDSFAGSVGPHLVQRLSGRMKTLSMWSGLTPTLSEQLTNRELDLAICTEATLDPRRVELRPLFSETFIAVAPRRFSGKRAPESFHEVLRELPLLRYTGRSLIGQQVERLIRHMNFNAPNRYEFDDTDPLLSLVGSGFGCAITSPLCLWQSRAHLADIAVVPLATTRIGHRHFYILTRQAEWSSMAEAVARESVAVTRDVIAPGLLAALPGAPPHLFDAYAAAFAAQSAA